MVVALDETNISSCLHFSMHTSELSCNLDPTSELRNVNLSQICSLFMDIWMTSFTYRYELIYMSFATNTPPPPPPLQTKFISLE